MSYVIKVCLVGDFAVGKTSLRREYLGKGFKTAYIQTIGADFSVVETMIKGVEFKFHIWDLAGQYKWENLTKLYYEGSKGFILVFDVTRPRPSSFDNIMSWVRKIKERVDEDIPGILIGNKIDLLPDSNSEINLDQAGSELAVKISQELNNSKYPVTFIQTSAKTGKNVDKAFQQLSEIISNKLI